MILDQTPLIPTETGPAGIRVDPIPTGMAAEAVGLWHYSRRMPNGGQACTTYGAWEHDVFIGTVIFAPGANPGIPKAFGLHPHQVRELARVALAPGHAAPTSQIVTAVIHRLHADAPGYRLLVSYADTGQGHLGKIYMAMNWTYLGPTTPEPGQYYDLGNGTIMHGRTARNLTRRQRAHGTPTLTALQALHPGATDWLPTVKHRYALGLDRPTRRMLKPLAMPYPR